MNPAMTESMACAMPNMNGATRSTEPKNLMIIRHFHVAESEIPTGLRTLWLFLLSLEELVQGYP